MPERAVIFDQRDRAEIAQIDADIAALKRQKMIVENRIRQRKWREAQKAKDAQING